MPGLETTEQEKIRFDDFVYFHFLFSAKVSCTFQSLIRNKLQKFKESEKRYYLPQLDQIKISMVPL